MVDIRVSATKAELQQNIGGFITLKAREAIEDHGFFSVAFSGGSVAQIVPAGLLQHADLGKLELAKWKIFFCDERYVDLANTDSNYNTVQDNFLSKVEDFKAENVITINPALSLEDAAKDYESKLKSCLGDQAKIDLLLIGMGPDGHICSLFPGHQLLNVSDRLVAAISDSPKPPPSRITLTYPAINSARCAVFIAAGSSKAEVVQRVLEGNEPDPLPAARVKLASGGVHWFMDQDAASKLKNQ